jgi:DNA-binding IclR family transcriptional regulator
MHEGPSNAPPAGGRRPRSDPRVYRVNVLERAIRILRSFERSRPRLTLGEVAEISRLPPSTTLRLLSTLAREGFVIRDPTTGHFALGYELIVLAEQARVQSALVECARPIMREIRDRIDETIYLSVRSGDFRIDLEQVNGSHSIRRVISLGELKPLYIGAAGKILLASLSDAEIDDYLDRTELKKFTERTIVDKDLLRAEVARIRRRGVAESVREKSADGAQIAVAITGARTTAGTLATTFSDRHLAEKRAICISALSEGANRISKILGTRAH